MITGSGERGWDPPSRPNSSSSRRSSSDWKAKEEEEENINKVERKSTSVRFGMVTVVFLVQAEREVWTLDPTERTQDLFLSKL